MGAIAATSPFDALFRLNDWQLAALIVVLVVVPGAVEQFEARHGRNPAPAGGATTPVVPGAVSPSRHVRPPRAC